MTRAPTVSGAQGGEYHVVDYSIKLLFTQGKEVLVTKKGRYTEVSEKRAGTVGDQSSYRWCVAENFISVTTMLLFTQGGDYQ